MTLPFMGLTIGQLSGAKAAAGHPQTREQTQQIRNLAGAHQYVKIPKT
jgi:hypothetical protein